MTRGYGINAPVLGIYAAFTKVNDLEKPQSGFYLFVFGGVAGAGADTFSHTGGIFRRHAVPHYRINVFTGSDANVGRPRRRGERKSRKALKRGGRLSPFYSILMGLKKSIVHDKVLSKHRPQ
jgi:hypothetical protein